MNSYQVSKARSAGDLAGVFEYDEETGYFCLYDQRRECGHTITDVIHIVSTTPDFEKSDVQVLWDTGETRVGLLIRGQVWAAFETTTGAKYGGNYRTDDIPSVPADVAQSFETRGSRINATRQRQSPTP